MLKLRHAFTLLQKQQSNRNQCIRKKKKKRINRLVWEKEIRISERTVWVSKWASKNQLPTEIKHVNNSKRHKWGKNPLRVSLCRQHSRMKERKKGKTTTTSSTEMENSLGAISMHTRCSLQPTLFQHENLWLFLLLLLLFYHQVHKSTSDHSDCVIYI